MKNETEKTTEANRRISRAESEDASRQLPESDDEVTRANVRIDRALDDVPDEPITPDPAVLRPPD